MASLTFSKWKNVTVIIKISAWTIVIVTKKWAICKQSCLTYVWCAFVYGSVSFSLSFSPCHRSQFSLRHLWHARNHRLAKIRRPAILRLYCTHLQNKNTHNKLITFYPQILVLMWITNSRISHTFLATRRFLAPVILIKKESSFMKTHDSKKTTNQTLTIIITV